MKSLAAIACLLALPAIVGVWPAAGAIPATRSASGQFVVYDSRGATIPSPVTGPATDTNFITLEPTLLVVSCERMRQKLWGTIGLAAPWRGRISFNLYPARSTEDMIAIVTEKLPGAWNYRVELPDTLPRDRFLRAIVQVLLLEIANRNPAGREAEIPAWLVEGLAAELRAASEIELLLPPPNLNVHGLAISSPIVHDARWSNPLSRAQQELRARPALTFEQLSWPGEGQLAGDAARIYRGSAQLFVDSLLRLPGGPASLRALLGELNRHYNWQIAFFRAFRAHFQNPLDVEKWWALQVVQFTGRDLTQTWPPDESLKRIGETLHLRVEVRATGNDMPLRSEVSLQTIIREWNRERQVPVLQAKLSELEVLRLRVAPSTVAVVEEYRRALYNYLQQQDSPRPFSLFRRRSRPASEQAANDAIRQLDALDLRREALGSPPTGVPAEEPPAGGP